MPENIKNQKKPSFFLHICCAGCGIYIAKQLRDEFLVKLFFYNPNIYPKKEYDKRLEEIKKISKKFKIEIMVGEYDHQGWLEKVKGYEKRQERGERCWICYRDRMEKAAQEGKKNNFDYFGTTLSISPHKDAGMISKIGKELEDKHKIRFFDQDFKKKDGFKKSSCLSRELGLYRQDYCGCEFSIR